jgi:2-amino-4-hydroxy-6-hydroxymethyldihydropteridine diphosphokinase
VAVCYLGIGSNLGNRRKNIELALSHLKKDRDIKVRKVSRLYETEAIGGPPQGKFLNGAIELDCKLSPQKLLHRLKGIELKLGRTKLQEKWGPRPIDLDILLFGDLVLKEKNLKIPHPLMDKRIFVLKPLCEIAPCVVHPLKKKTIAELLKKVECKQGSLLNCQTAKLFKKYSI